MRSLEINRIIILYIDRSLICIFNHVPSIIAWHILILYKANISDTCVYLWRKIQVEIHQMIWWMCLSLHETPPVQLCQVLQTQQQQKTIQLCKVLQIQQQQKTIQLCQVLQIQQQQQKTIQGAVSIKFKHKKICLSQYFSKNQWHSCLQTKRLRLIT